jgi:hypothetical protein
LILLFAAAACSSHPHPHPVGPPTPKGSATPVEVEPDAGAPDAPASSLQWEPEPAPGTTGPQVRSAVSSPVGTIDLEAFQVAVRAVSHDLLRCYEDRFGPPTGSISVGMKVSFDANGHVVDTDVGTLTELAPCVTKVLGTIVVPPPDGSRSSVVLRITYAAR